MIRNCTQLTHSRTQELDLQRHARFRRGEDIPPPDHSQITPELNPGVVTRMVCVLYDHRTVARADTVTLRPDKPLLSLVHDFPLLTEPLQYFVVLR
jgi:hypothetical protein